MQKVQVLISTMHRINGDYRLLEEMNILSNALVINQSSTSEEDVLQYKEFEIKWINSNQRGLSKSRNQALLNAAADICIVADDDLVYCNDYVETITKAFEDNPDADIIAFQVNGIEKKFKDYSCKEKNIGYLNSMKISSVQIAFRLKSIKEKKITFDELFGTGSFFCMGEENIFLFDCLKNGLKIKYMPKVIAYLHIGESTWFKGFNQQYFHDKGAAYTRLSKKFSLLFIFQFAIRKRKLFKNEMNVFNAIRYMIKGKKTYSKILKKY